MEARLRGVERLDGPITVSLDGPYESNGEGKLPSLDWDVSVQAAGLRFKGGVVVTDDNAFIEFGGRTYEVGTQLFASLSKRFSNGGGVGSLKGLGLDPASWLQDPQVDEGDDVGGDATRKIKRLGERQGGDRGRGRRAALAGVSPAARVAAEV